MVVQRREIASSIRDRMRIYDAEMERQKRKHSDGPPPSTLVHTKSPMVQRRAAAGRFAHRSAASRARDDEDSRIPLRKAAPGGAGSASRDALRTTQPRATPDDQRQKLRSADRVTGDVSDRENQQMGESERRLQSVSPPAGAVQPGRRTSPDTPSFLEDRSKVTGIRDVLSRMDASNSEVASSDDAARSLLNKFLGAQVMMTGMESMMAQSASSQTVTTAASGQRPTASTRSQRSQFRTSRDEDGQWKTQMSHSSSASVTPSAGEAVVVCGVNITDVTDQDKLHEMLEQCDNFDERKKIRARLMVLMQEAKARREQAQRRRLQHQQQRDGGSVSTHEAKMINDWLADNFDSDGNDSSAEAKMSSASSVVTKTSTSKTVTSSQRSQLTKGKTPVSAFDKFKQLDSASPKPVQKTDSGSSDGGGFKLDAGLAAKAQGAKEMTLYWAQCRTRDYQNVKVENFSTSWNDGMAFCALIHHFYPDAFDFDKLNPKNRRYNFDLAFKTADEKAGIYPLLDTDDMVAMRKPDWKCVFTYVQAIYRRLKDGPVSPNA